MTSGIPVEDWIAYHARFAPRSEAAHDLASGRRFTYARCGSASASASDEATASRSSA
jgi:hypothetical protein